MNIHDPLVQLAIAVIVAAAVWFFTEYEITVEKDDE